MLNILFNRNMPVSDENRVLFIVMSLQFLGYSLSHPSKAKREPANSVHRPAESLDRKSLMNGGQVQGSYSLASMSATR
jgi:hypothetical protein